MATAAQNNLFADIATRTNGDIYIGVVGPVRCGKSTFISRFMKSMVIPRVEGRAEQQRVIDELPQSGDGTAVMTTSPKFVPAKAVQIKVAGAASMKVRMVDCVGYMIPGANASQADGKVRNVRTPWSDAEMPFEKAAEIGTKKVIADHSTVAVCMTTDGTVCEISRSSYLEAEERTIKELKKSGKPFVVVVNSRTPASGECRKVASEIANKHDVAVLPVDVDNMTTENINQIFGALLAEFGVSGFKVNLPKWLCVLDGEHEIICEAVEALKSYTKGIKRLSDNNPVKVFEKSAHYEKLETVETDVATGMITFNVVPKPDLYYKVISGECGVQIRSEQELVAYIRQLGAAKSEYDKIKGAMEQVEASGYGIVSPQLKDYTLDTPQLYKNGKSYGVRLRASAPSLHIIKVDVATEVTPTIGSQSQSEEMLQAIRSDFETDMRAVWDTNIFGKSLETIVQDGINGKCMGMHGEAQKKMKRTLTKIVNNGKGGVICILL